LSFSQVQKLIAELNEILAHDVVDEAGLWKKKLTPQSLELFEFLPQAIQEQLMLERDPHGNVQVSVLYPDVYCVFAVQRRGMLNPLPILWSLGCQD